MNDYSKLKVNDIKQMLIDEGRYNKEELDKLEVKGKSEWVSLHKGDSVVEDIDKVDNEENEEMVWEDLADMADGILPPETKTNEKPKANTPHYSDPGWHDYVMSHFEKGELIDGKYPNVNALRRLVELLLGEIAFSGPINVQQTMTPDHTGKAVVTYQVTIDWKLDAFYEGVVDREYPQRTFTSVASSWIGNTDDMFAVFPECIAETRAEARALRRALRINVVSSDELTKKDAKIYIEQQNKSTTGDWDENETISDAQSNTIQMMCKRLGINMHKFINSGSKTYKDINNVTKLAAAGMIKQLNRYQSSGNDAIDIPENLIGD